MTTLIPPELKALCPETNKILLFCEECNVVANRWRLDRKYEWARVLYCSCGKDWLVCGLCDRVRTRLTTSKAASGHNHTIHIKKKEEEICGITNGKRRRPSDSPHNMSCSSDNVTDNSMEGEIWMQQRMLPRKYATTTSLLLKESPVLVPETRKNISASTETITTAGTMLSGRDFGNRHSTMYFNADINGSGVAEIVALGQFGITSLGAELHPSDVQYTTDIANFVHDLSQTQRRDLSHILAGTVAKINRDKCGGRMWKTNIPCSPEDMRRQYWDGKMSFLGNVPFPTVESVGDHAYTSIRECIRNRLAFGFGIERLEIVQDETLPTRSTMQSLKCQRIIRKCKNMYDEPVLILFLKEWQDGYDPHSFSKSNRGSVWIKTITISEPHEHKNQAEYTYAVALGPASSSHEEVEARFAAELKLLSDPSANNLFYSKIHQGEVRVHSEIICSLMDQPERRGSNWMMGGNSSYAARWGYSINLHAVHQVLVPCEACGSRLLGGDLMWNSERCGFCAQWEMIRDDDMLYWNAPKGFPLDGKSGEKFMRPKRLDYNLLRYAVDTTHQRIVSGQWSETDADMFLASYCLNGKVSSAVSQHARNMRALNSLADNGSSVEDYQVLLKQQAQSPEQFRPWSYPSFWNRGLDLNSQVDAPMHLLFLGAVKGVMIFVHSWLKRHEKYSDFMRRAEDRLATLVKFRLPWLCILPYKGDKLGGWVSENFVSFSKICKWFYEIVDDIKEDGPRYSDPAPPQSRWRADENRKWLKVRGLPTEGLATELRERVAAYMLQDSVPTILSAPEGTMEDVHGLVDSMYDMIKAVMTFQVDKSAVDYADFCIKKFLTHVVHCDKKLHPKAKIPFWISSYNFPCLLSLPQHMAEFGPLKNLWEGGVRGEGYLRFMKPLHGTIGIRNGWAVQIMNKVHQKKGLRAMGTSIEDYDTVNDQCQGESMVDDLLWDVKCSYWKYPDSETVYNDFVNKKALCLVCLQSGVFGAMLRTGEVVRFLCEMTDNLLVRGMNYLHWELELDKNSLVSRGLVLLKSTECLVQYSCILLPKQISPDRILYLAVRENYTMLDDQGKFN